MKAKCCSAHYPVERPHVSVQRADGEQEVSPLRRTVPLSPGMTFKKTTAHENIQFYAALYECATNNMLSNNRPDKKTEI